MVRVLPLILFAALTGCDDKAMADAGRAPLSEQDVDGVVALDPLDKQLKAAIAKAKQEFSKFRAMWAKRQPSDVFVVKKTFTDGRYSSRCGF